MNYFSIGLTLTPVPSPLWGEGWGEGRKQIVKSFKSFSPHLRLATLLFIGFTVLGSHTALNVWPALGARGADGLRTIFGDQAVAQIEMIVFQIQDAAARLSQSHSTNGISPAGPLVSGESSSSDWLPKPLPASGRVAGEGAWVSYLQDVRGRTVAYRTFLLPDSQRLYAQATILAFDLNATRLHFVLGTDEPKSSVTIERSGKIPSADLRPGGLLAVLNGGFKARHGGFGVMADGITLLPLRDGVGTVATYGLDGLVRIGRWGEEITVAPDLVAARQNGPLIIHAGVVNPYTEFTETRDWGYIVGNNTPTWRSGLGLSADGRTLYYAVGPGLTLSRLAEVLATTGAAEALQLDINKAWVYAGAAHLAEAKLQVQPLLDFMSEINDLENHSFSRDFFYITGQGDD